MIQGYLQSLVMLFVIGLVAWALVEITNRFDK
jgi:hypothetical protein